MLKNVLVSLCLLAPLAVGAGAAEAASKPSPDRATMVERHEKMSELHKQTAECLKTEKTIAECRGILKKGMPSVKPGECLMGEDCPMRSMRKTGRGKGKRMGQQAPSPDVNDDE